MFSLPNVKIGSSKLSKSKFSFSPQNSTSFGFGEIQPTYFQPLLPNSTINVDMREVVRMGVLSVPTFGKLVQKHYARFVENVQVWKPWEDFLAQRPHHTENGSFIPTKVPYLTVGVLSQLLLQANFLGLSPSFCKVRIALGTPVSTTSSTTIKDTYSNVSYLEFDSSVNEIFTNFSDLRNQAISNLVSQYPYFSLAFNTLITDWPSNFFDPLFSSSSLTKLYMDDVYDWTGSITFDSADFIVSLPSEYDGNTSAIILFKLTKTGSNLMKIMRGLGFKFDLNSSRPFEIPRILAFYKAYFDTFSPQNNSASYNSFANTYCSYLIEYFDHNDVQNMTSNNTALGYFKNLLYYMSICYYFEDPDFITAHIASPAIHNVTYDFNVNNPSSLSSSLSTTLYTNFQPRNSQTALNFSYATPTGLTAPGLKLLMRMYKYVNKNTILGARVREFLKSQFGYDVKDDDTYDVGFASLNLNISDIFSTSDTLQVVDSELQGAALGQYGGKGIGYTGDGSSNPDYFQFKFSTPNRHGYFFVLSCIVPVTGRCQGYNPLVSRGTGSQWEIYQDMLDSLDYEITNKDSLLAETPVSVGHIASDGTERSIDKYSMPFGFIPRMFPYKYQDNNLNGDFAKRGLKSQYLPFTLDNIITNEKTESVISNTELDGRQVTYSSVSFTDPITDLPTATPELRSVGKYSWFGNFGRIFMTNPSLSDTQEYVFGFDNSITRDDDFLCHISMNIDYFANMKPASESFETDGEDDSTISVKKA